MSSFNSNNKLNKLNKGEIFLSKNGNINKQDSKNDEILIYDSFVKINNNNFNTDNNYLNISGEREKEKRTTTVKKLRKKYERTEFKKYIYNTNPKINRYYYQNQDDKYLDSNIE